MKSFFVIFVLACSLFLAGCVGDNWYVRGSDVNVDDLNINNTSCDDNRFCHINTQYDANFGMGADFFDAVQVYGGGVNNSFQAIGLLNPALIGVSTTYITLQHAQGFEFNYLVNAFSLRYWDLNFDNPDLGLSYTSFDGSDGEFVIDKNVHTKEHFVTDTNDICLPNGTCYVFPDDFVSSDQNIVTKATWVKKVYVNSVIGTDNETCGIAGLPCQSPNYAIANRTYDVFAASVEVICFGSWETGGEEDDPTIYVNKVGMINGTSLALLADDYITPDIDARSTVVTSTNNTLTYHGNGGLADAENGWDGAWVWIQSTDANSQVRQITLTEEIADGNILITVSPNWTTNPPAGAKFGIAGRAMINFGGSNANGIIARGGATFLTVRGWDFNNFQGGIDFPVVAVSSERGAYVNMFGNIATGQNAQPEGGTAFQATYNGVLNVNRCVCYKQSNCVVGSYNGIANGFITIIQNTGWNYGYNQLAENMGVIRSQANFSYGGAYSLYVKGNSLGYLNSIMYGEDGSSGGIYAAQGGGIYTAATGFSEATDSGYGSWIE